MASSCPTRDYSICFEHRPDCLYVKVDAGEASYEIVRRYWSEIIAMQHRRGYSRVMVVDDIAGELSTTDLYTFVTELAASGLQGVAFVIVPRRFDPDASEFEEMVGTNRGLNLRVCGKRRGDEYPFASRRATDHPMRMALAH